MLNIVRTLHAIAPKCLNIEVGHFPPKIRIMDISRLHSELHNDIPVKTAFISNLMRVINVHCSCILSKPVGVVPPIKSHM